MNWKATAFCADTESDYSVAWEGDHVEVNHDHGIITVTISEGNVRRAHFVIPAALLVPPKDSRTLVATPNQEEDFG